MKREELKPNRILRGPIFPEPVQVIVCTPLDDAVQLIGKGILSGRDDDVIGPQGRKRAKSGGQTDLFAATADAESPAETVSGPSTINSEPSTFSVLDRVRQSMILFAAGRSEALTRFLVEDLPTGQAGAAGNDARFWTLAQALSARYPASTDERRWVDGALARKKGLGFLRTPRPPSSIGSNSGGLKNWVVNSRGSSPTHGIQV